MIDKKVVTLDLIVERGKWRLWGRVLLKGHLLVESATSLVTLQKKMKSLLSNEITGISNKNIEFNIKFDLTAFFEKSDFLNMSGIAKHAKINPTLLRQYVSGNKFPSEERVKEIENVIRKIGKELLQTKLATRHN